MLKVVVDGENFRHHIAYTLVDAGRMHQDVANDFFRFRVRDFFADVLQESDIEILYCTTKIKHPDFEVPLELLNHIERINEANRRWVSYLSNQSVTVIKAGNLRVHESAACGHCGKHTLGLQEKGVDVRVATEVILAAESSQPVVLVSSDSDIIPAIEAARKLQGIVTYLCPADRLNRSVAAQASQTITYDHHKVFEYYEEA